MKWWVSIASCLVLFGVIGSFAYSKMGFIINGVQIQASINRENDSSVIYVKGTARNAVYITLNGREIFIDRDGSFTEQVALLPGLSVVTIDAEDKFGNTSAEKFELVYKEATGVFAYNKVEVDKN